MSRLQIDEQVSERAVRASGRHPAQRRLACSMQLHAVIDEAVRSATTRRLGCRISATNHPAQPLTLDQAMRAYREEYLVERGVGRVIGRPLSLSPMDVPSDQRARGLIHLLSLALRVLTRLQGQCRQWLADQHERVAGWYAGNPKRSTARPTAEAILHAFELIHLSGVPPGQQAHRHLSPLSALQQRLLGWLNLSAAIYERLAAQSPKPPCK